MAGKSKSGKAPSGDWITEILRLTAFPTPPAPPRNPEWWSALVGEQPQTVVTQPRTGEHREEGPFRNAVLVSSIQLNRIDWLLRPNVEDPRAIDFPMVGSFTEAVEPFVEVMLKWLSLDTCPSLQRLAFGTILQLPVDDRPTGYRLLSTYLPYVTIDLEHTRDFLYQINRPRESNTGIGGLSINRLAKWSVGSGQWVDVLLTTPRSSESIWGRWRAFCRLELDVNTAAEFGGPLPKDRLTSVLLELIDLSKEIISEGDTL